MNNIVLKFLLGRGVGKLTESLSKIVRHAVTTYGGVLVAQGHASQDDLTTLAGAGTILVSVAVSVARALIAKKIPE